MATIAVLVSPRTFAVSLGAMTDLRARLGEVFESNTALGDYAQVETRLALAPVIPGAVALAGGLPLACDATFAALPEPRLVYLPAFQIAAPEQLDAILAAAAPCHRWLAESVGSDTPIGAAGASVFHLAAAGVLDGHECVVPPRLALAFRERFPRVRVEELGTLCISGRIMTCSRDAHGGALALRLFGAAISPRVAVSLALREPPEGDAGFDAHEPDPVVARARTWIRDRFARDFRILDLASELGISHQALIRRFRAAGGDTPRGYVQQLRAETAATLLIETRRPIAEIAQLVGYRDTASFRGIFIGHTGMTPAEYRRTAPRRGAVQLPPGK